ncbi:hypothetical protein C8F04DRAFT_1068144 [Mycena alexandri]|uniref:Uncharacterized protein n=1 Tax=Mycena alexandri TaxID=1745969 RepID=A0AAD6TGG6_9AGAR|nr:hypothetical protein C8F04DRAFT_1068144 [Mycena alexandri]
MALLPQELVEAIICEVDDVPTLKASCLAGSTFREESQRNLFQSFELNCQNRRRLDGLRTLLSESPHIGSYVVHLTLGHLSDLDTPDVDIFLHMISTSELKNVRRCHVTEVTSEFLGWSAVLDFLSHQPLHEMRVTSANLPADIFFRLLATAPVISFRNISFTQPIDYQMLEQQPHVSKVQDLALEKNTKLIVEILLRPQLRDYTERLVRLTVICAQNTDGTLISATAGTLQHIGFDIRSPFDLPETFLIPPLPALRSVEFFLYFSWLDTHSDLILTVLDCSPLLANLTVSHTGAAMHDDKLLIDAGLLNRLDTALVAHPAGPSIRWRLNLDLGGEDVENGGRFVDFVGLVQRSMPQAHDKGRLLVEA